MKCKNCPGKIDCSNESAGSDWSCWYGDSYLDDNCVDYKDGSCGCGKTAEEVESDMKAYEDAVRNEECLQELERETRLRMELAYNYDFERGDVKY